MSSRLGKMVQMALEFFSPALADMPGPGLKTPPDQGRDLPLDLQGQSGHNFHHPLANRHTVLQGTPISYRYQSVRRKTIGMLVSADGLEVRAPRWVGRADIESALQERSRWILRTLARTHQIECDRLAQTLCWANEALVPYLGHSLRLMLDPSLDFAKQAPQGAHNLALQALDTDDQARWHLRLGLPLAATQTQIRDATKAWLMQEALRLFTQRLDHFAPLLGVQWRKLSLSNAQTRWGTASADGHIRLNWRLLHFKPEVIDYVVTHELSHLRVMNHSPQFWDTVASVMPDYKNRRQDLKRETMAPWA